MRECRQQRHRWKFVQYLHLHPPPEKHVPEMRGQGVHAQALRIRAFWSEIGRTPGCPACETPGPGKSHIRAGRIKMPGKKAAEQHQRTRRDAELLEIRTLDRWTQVRAQQIPTRRDQKQPLRQTTIAWRTKWKKIIFKEDQRHHINWNQSMMKTC